MDQLLAGDGYIRALIWTLAALVLFIVLLFAVRMIRGFGSGTLIAGGRNRVPRLAVVDAAAVDNQRRLVLVRRDDVEHLILIGGPSDLVVEQQIRAPQAGMARPQPRAAAPQPQAQARRPSTGRQEPVVSHPPAASRSQAAPRAAPEAPRSNPAPAVERPPQGTAAAAVSSREPVQQAPAASREEPRAATSHSEHPKHEQAHPQATEEETALLENIDLSIDEIRTAPPSSKDSDESLDDEMSRLLNDLSNEKKG